MTERVAADILSLPMFPTLTAEQQRRVADAVGRVRDSQSMNSKRVWIDLDNTPHVPFFLPIIRALEREGHSVLVTARDAFQVREVAAYHGLACRIVGRHYGANKVHEGGRNRLARGSTGSRWCFAGSPTSRCRTVPGPW